MTQKLAKKTNQSPDNKPMETNKTQEKQNEEKSKKDHIY